MKKIGLFFGTFNPIHNGHLMMANYIVNNTDIDKVLFVVNPTAPFKKNEKLLPFDDRVNLIRLSTIGDDNIRPTLIENGLEQPTYTYNTFRAFKESAPDFEYVLILGADNLNKLSKWRNSKEIIENNPIYVCPRNGVDVESQIEKIKSEFKVKDIQVLNGAPECNLSSTFIRDQIKNGKSITHYVPTEVKNYLYITNFFCPRKDISDEIK